MPQDNQATPTAAEAQTGPGWTSPGPAGSRYAPIAKSEEDAVGSGVRDLWRNTMETSALQPLQGWFDSSNELAKRIAEAETKAGHPVRAAIADAGYVLQKTVTDFVSGASTPSNATLGILSGGSSFASKALLASTSAYFAWRGSQQMLEAHIDGESKLDEITRRTEGLLQAAGGVHGMQSGYLAMKESVRQNIQNNLGLGGDLAKLVQDKFEAAFKAGREAVAKLRGVDTTLKSQIDTAQSIATAGEQAASKDIPIQLKAIISSAAQTVAIEKAKFNIEYKEIYKNATEPVTSNADLRAEITNSLKSEGLTDAEIEKVKGKIFAALPPVPRVAPEVSMPAMPGGEPSATPAATDMAAGPAATDAVQRASRFAADAGRQGLLPKEIRSALRNMNYRPNQVDQAMNLAFPTAPETQNVDFETTKRVKEDIYQASQSATDSATKRGLDEAYQNVEAMRQRYADAQGFGEAYGKLNQRYMKFMREMGSGTMDEFLKAHDYNEQNTILAAAQHLTANTGEGLRGLLALAGVDVTPLETALKNKEAFQDMPGQVNPEAQKVAQAQRTAILGERNAAITAIDEKKAIIPGESDLALAGKGNVQIRLDALREIADNARRAGITNPGAYIQIMYGTARVLFGSPLGGFSAMSGASRIGVENLLRSKGFGEWVAQESGVTPAAMPKFLRSLAKSYPFLEQIAGSTLETPFTKAMKGVAGVPNAGQAAAAGLNTAGKKNKSRVGASFSWDNPQPIMTLPEPPKPAPPAGNLSIAGSK